MSVGTGEIHTAGGLKCICERTYGHTETFLSELVAVKVSHRVVRSTGLTWETIWSMSKGTKQDTQVIKQKNVRHAPFPSCVATADGLSFVSGGDSHWQVGRHLYLIY